MASLFPRETVKQGSTQVAFACCTLPTYSICKLEFYVIHAESMLPRSDLFSMATLCFGSCFSAYAESIQLFVQSECHRLLSFAFQGVPFPLAQADNDCHALSRMWNESGQGRVQFTRGLNVQNISITPCPLYSVSYRPQGLGRRVLRGLALASLSQKHCVGHLLMSTCPAFQQRRPQAASNDPKRSQKLTTARATRR